MYVCKEIYVRHRIERMQNDAASDDCDHISFKFRECEGSFEHSSLDFYEHYRKSTRTATEVEFMAHSAELCTDCIISWKC